MVYFPSYKPIYHLKADKCEYIIFLNKITRALNKAAAV